MIAFDFPAVLAEWPLLARGLAATLALTAISATVGVSLGVACAWARLHGAPWLKAIVSAYVELIRNTPFIVQLFFLFFGLPGIGIRLSPEVASVLAMVVNLGAYAAEIVRFTRARAAETGDLDLNALASRLEFAMEPLAAAELARVAKKLPAVAPPVATRDGPRYVGGLR